MQRSEAMDARLQRWAQWVTVGDGSGYPVTNTLHPNWSPPSKGRRPTLKVTAGSDARQTHRAIGELSQRLQNTLVVHYCQRLPLEVQAQRLECTPDTVLVRVRLAHRVLLSILADDRITEEGQVSK
jgi:DNA-directed RNA polymerase specialized sigma24 family protein